MAKKVDPSKIIGLVKRIADGAYEPVNDLAAARLTEISSHRVATILRRNIPHWKKMARAHGYTVLLVNRCLRPASHKAIAPVRLSAEQWIEVSEAIGSKIVNIRRGYYGPQDKPGDNARWTAELEAIQESIGADGELAAKNGVAPVDNYGG